MENDAVMDLRFTYVGNNTVVIEDNRVDINNNSNSSKNSSSNSSSKINNTNSTGTNIIHSSAITTSLPTGCEQQPSLPLGYITIKPESSPISTFPPLCQLDSRIVEFSTDKYNVGNQQLETRRPDAVEATRIPDFSTASTCSRMVPGEYRVVGHVTTAGQEYSVEQSGEIISRETLETKKRRKRPGPKSKTQKSGEVMGKEVSETTTLTKPQQHQKKSKTKKAGEMTQKMPKAKIKPRKSVGQNLISVKSTEIIPEAMETLVNRRTSLSEKSIDILRETTLESLVDQLKNCCERSPCKMDLNRRKRSTCEMDLDRRENLTKYAELMGSAKKNLMTVKEGIENDIGEGKAETGADMGRGMGEDKEDSVKVKQDQAKGDTMGLGKDLLVGTGGENMTLNGSKGEIQQENTECVENKDIGRWEQEGELENGSRTRGNDVLVENGGEKVGECDQTGEMHQEKCREPATTSDSTIMMTEHPTRAATDVGAVGLNKVAPSSKPPLNIEIQKNIAPTKESAPSDPPQPSNILVKDQVQTSFAQQHQSLISLPIKDVTSNSSNNIGITNNQPPSDPHNPPLTAGSTRRGRSVHPCPVCGHLCSSRFILSEHLRIHTGEKPHVCAECGRSFRHLNSLRAHRRVHVRPSQSGAGGKCVVQTVRAGVECTVAAASVEELQRHNMAEVHGEIMTDQRKSEVASSQCVECGMKMADIEGLEKHMKEVHESVQERKGQERINDEVVIAQSQECAMEEHKKYEKMGMQGQKTQESHLNVCSESASQGVLVSDLQDRDITKGGKETRKKTRKRTRQWQAFVSHCGLCGLEMTRVGEWTQHMRTVHGVVVKEKKQRRKTAEEPQVNPSQCTVCELDGLSVGDFAQHMVRVHGREVMIRNTEVRESELLPSSVRGCQDVRKVGGGNGPSDGYVGMVGAWGVESEQSNAIEPFDDESVINTTVMQPQSTKAVDHQTVAPYDTEITGNDNGNVDGNEEKVDSESNEIHSEDVVQKPKKKRRKKHESLTVGQDDVSDFMSEPVGALDQNLPVMNTIATVPSLLTQLDVVHESDISLCEMGGLNPEVELKTGKKRGRKSSLVADRQIHEGGEKKQLEKKHACEVCGKRYVRKGALTQHLLLGHVAGQGGQAIDGQCGQSQDSQSCGMKCDHAVGIKQEAGDYGTSVSVYREDEVAGLLDKLLQ